MIVKQILLVSTLENIWRTVWRKCILILKCNGLKDYFQDLPEVPDVDITVDENVQLVELGVVFSVVESLGKI